MDPSQEKRKMGTPCPWLQTNLQRNSDKITMELEKEVMKNNKDFWNKTKHMALKLH